MKTQYNENEVIGYIDGMAIIKDDADRWFFIEIPEAFVTSGEQMLEDDLTPLELLNIKEQQKILKEMVD